MSNSEKLYTFNEKRNEFNPYGLTCELWSPSLMRRADRHNEIEINFCPGGSISYLFKDRKINIPTKTLTVFWGLVPHQIIDYQGMAPYFVCTIPFSQFMDWKLPSFFTDAVLNGEVLLDPSPITSVYDEYLLNNWVKDLENTDSAETVLLEVHARLRRMASKYSPKKLGQSLALQTNEISPVEKMAMYIAKNYHAPIRVPDIGKSAGLHPDYANSIFKKAFGSTLSKYLIEERVAQAQRQLVATDKKITQIAFDCGFNSVNRFNAAFQKVNQSTPRDFRKKYR